MRKIIIYLLLLFPYVLNNSDKMKGFDSALRFFKLSRSFELIYPMIYIVIFVFVILERLVFRKMQKLNKKEFMLLFMVLLYCLSIFFNLESYNSSFINAFQTINKYLRMFIIYVIFYEYFPRSRVKLDTFNKVNFSYFTLTSLFAWYQILVKDAYNDLVTGLNSTAHIYSMVILFFLPYIVFYLVERKVLIKYFYLIVFFVIPMIQASFVKGFIVFLLSLFLYQIVINYHKINVVKVFKSLFILVVLLLSSALLLKELDTKVYYNLSKLTRIDVRSIPYYNNVINVPKFLGKDIKTFLFGVGPGNFGSRVSMAQGKSAVDEFNEVVKTTRKISDFGLSPSMKNPTSAMLSLLVEGGVVIFILYLLFLWKLFKKTKDILIIEGDYLVKSTLIVFFVFLIYNFLIPEHMLFGSNLFNGFLAIYLAIIHSRFDIFYKDRTNAF